MGIFQGSPGSNEKKGLRVDETNGGSAQAQMLEVVRVYRNMATRTGDPTNADISCLNLQGGSPSAMLLDTKKDPTAGSAFRRRWSGRGRSGVTRLRNDDMVPWKVEALMRFCSWVWEAIRSVCRGGLSLDGANCSRAGQIKTRAF